MSRSHPASSPMAEGVPRASGDEPIPTLQERAEYGVPRASGDEPFFHRNPKA